jgi:ribonuclease-3
VQREEGPDHRRRFRIECRLDDGTVTVGEGTSKKAAQQAAALEALSRLEAAEGSGLMDGSRRSASWPAGGAAASRRRPPRTSSW